MIGMTEKEKEYPKCPECGGQTRKVGFLITRKGRHQQYQCTKCGRRFKGGE